MNVVTIRPPERRGQEVLFRWNVEPKSPLYRREQFTLRFPSDVDLDRVPSGTWWAVALLALHNHWPLLRPCRVVLPVRLSAAETECWLRLLDAAATTLDYYRGADPHGRSIEIVSTGPSWSSGPPAVDSGRCVTAFSGGKDSLLQAGLLCETTARPVLVAVTSPMPGMHDHTTPRRRHVLNEMRRRRDVDLIEVESDYRSCWVNDFARSVGFTVSVNELCDTLLYTASALAAGLARGATHLFVASEAEVQENAVHDGAVVQHSHFMYSLPTLRALDGLLRPLGARIGSLTPSLHSFQVQELLWTRYRDLRDLQYSCWRVGPNQETCSRCGQCFRIAMGALALGDRPGLMGVDLVKLLPSSEGFEPTVLRADGAESPQRITRASLHAAVVRDVLAAPTWRVLAAIARDQPHSLLRRDGWNAVAAYQRLRRRLSRTSPGLRPGFRSGFLSLVDPLLRDRLARIYAAHFSVAEPSSYAGVLGRSDRLARHVLEPLDARASAAA